MKALILVWNDFTHDKRVMNISESISSLGYICTVVASKHIKTLPSKEKGDYYDTIRIPVFSSLYRKNQDNVTQKSFNKSLKREIVNKIKKNKLRTTIVTFFNWFIFNIGLVRIGIKYKPDLIYCNDLNTVTIGYVLSKIFKSKIVFDSHELWLFSHSYQNSTFLRKKYWSYIQRKLIHKFNAVITTTNNRARYLEKQYKLQKVHTIMNCPKFELYKKTNKFREELGIDQRKIIFLYQGSLSAKRGVYNIIDAVETIDNIVLVLMGMGKEKPEIAEYIYRHNLTEKCFIVDAVSPKELISYTSSADVGFQLLLNVNLNHYSTISNKIFEYIMAGLGIIGSDFPEIRKIIAENKIGMVVDPSNKSEILNAIKKIAENGNQLKKFKSNSVKISTKYSWEVEETKLIKIVESL